MNHLKSQTIKLKTKRVFLKQGTCSRTFFFILNREFGVHLPEEEQAVDMLAGGIAQQGYQCGMLWGATMAIGAEAYRRHPDLPKAMTVAMLATQHVVKSFKNRAKSTDCFDITRCDFTAKLGILRYLLSGKMWTCFDLAGKWAPEAIRAAREGLDSIPENVPELPVSCASEVVRRMGGSPREQVMVAGFAGGIGLCGGGCGALAAAIWMNMLQRIRAKNYKYSVSDPQTMDLISRFLEASGYEMECSAIVGKTFASVEDHASFIRDGGCSSLMGLV